MKDFLINLLGRAAVLDEPGALAPYREDYSEAAPADPALVAFVTEAGQVQAILREAGRVSAAVTPRVAGTNVGGLALAAPAPPPYARRAPSFVNPSTSPLKQRNPLFTWRLKKERAWDAAAANSLPPTLRASHWAFLKCMARVMISM